MTRYFYQATKPLEKYEIYHGYDADVKKWFIELNICCHGTGNVVQWYNDEKEYISCLRNYTH
tara:strand:- start:937 stop:1122 length:186 start_codon:yes stop_codon:yes gene_type:complete